MLVKKLIYVPKEGKEKDPIKLLDEVRGDLSRYDTKIIEYSLGQVFKIVQNGSYYFPTESVEVDLSRANDIISLMSREDLVKIITEDQE